MNRWVECRNCTWPIWPVAGHFLSICYHAGIILPLGLPAHAGGRTIKGRKQLLNQFKHFIPSLLSNSITLTPSFKRKLWRPTPSSWKRGSPQPRRGQPRNRNQSRLERCQISVRMISVSVLVSWNLVGFTDRRSICWGTIYWGTVQEPQKKDGPLPTAPHVALLWHSADRQDSYRHSGYFWLARRHPSPWSTVFLAHHDLL